MPPHFTPSLLRILPCAAPYDDLRALPSPGRPLRVLSAFPLHTPSNYVCPSPCLLILRLRFLLSRI